ncbi:MAG: zinc-binding dehydrogenase, partial [Rhizobiales bacterium]|nr:zinc-binding dehydrogenase [Hyphomicrobiales bacterium]
ATVVAMCSAWKAPEVKAIGADETVDRNADLVKELGEASMDAVVDLVAGEQWPSFLDVLRRGGKYVTAGAIAGPIAQIDVRTLYLKDLTLYGCTFQDDGVFENLVSYIEAGEVRPVIARTYPLSDIARAQEDFLSKGHTGKLVLIPPQKAG